VCVYLKFVVNAFIYVDISVVVVAAVVTIGGGGRGEDGRCMGESSGAGQRQGGGS
jgi:hypothetical protein